MDSIINFFSRVANSITSSASGFNDTTWGVLAVVTVVVGYMLLRGNLVRP